ncbi:efflux transporter periplasmic adaptor subunit [Aliifodinibius salipaludis]|uniref:Efflux transporter periplasmic adaptor subunit n=2 Tax=Fodinibius salipaludis TaxID=2032627 RepID=A0A2A2GFB8_9BACT|nr:efflux transporter periplasmic adaptor subunit [Aliifodinibius salipaludis]
MLSTKGCELSIVISNSRMNKSYSSGITYLFIIAVLPFFILSCGDANQQQGQQQVEEYPVLELQPRSIELTSSYPATLEGKQTVEIRPRVPGYIIEMHVDEGDWVSKDQVLFTLNNVEYQQEVRSAKADIQAAKARVSTAEDEVERQQSLVDKEIVSQYQLQSAKNELESNQAALAQAESRLKNAQVNLGYTEVKSPVTGIIGTIPYRIGSLVNSSISQPMTVVSDISEVYAYFSMSERELLEMARTVSSDGEDQTIQQRVAEMPQVNLLLADNSRYEHQGTLKLASGLIDKETGSASFRATFPNPQEILRSGGSGNVEIPFNQDAALVIPKKATYEIQNKRFAYVVTDSNTVESREVSFLPVDTKQLFVVNEGIAEGARIVSSGIGQLDDGTKIKPNTVDADSLYQSLTESE